MKKKENKISMKKNNLWMIATVVFTIAAIMLTSQDEQQGAFASSKATKKTKHATKKIKRQEIAIRRTVWRENGVAMVKIPAKYRFAKPATRTFQTGEYSIRLSAASFALGNAVYVEIVPRTGEFSRENNNTEFTFDGSLVPLTPMRWGFRGLFAIPPDSRPGLKKIVLKTGRKDDLNEFQLIVVNRVFEVYRRGMDLGQYSEEDLLKNRPDLQARVDDETRRKEIIFATIGQDVITSKLSHPRNEHKITSTFYAKRITEQYSCHNGKKVRALPKVRFHNGVDLKGRNGAPIYAIASGIVVVAENMFYEGNQVILDHGNGIFTRYMHMSKINVQPGMYVEGGRVIGLCGNTGMVTGPHLHAGFLVRGVYVDPLSFLSLPIKD
jgi:murein DD-endopeptidase MepM/ murein hydrolase activator NlpD